MRRNVPYPSVFAAALLLCSTSPTAADQTAVGSCEREVRQISLAMSLERIAFDANVLICAGATPSPKLRLLIESSLRSASEDALVGPKDGVVLTGIAIPNLLEGLNRAIIQTRIHGFDAKLIDSLESLQRRLPTTETDSAPVSK